MFCIQKIKKETTSGKLTDGNKTSDALTVLPKDGACDISDETELLKALAGTATLENGDIDKDGTCDISDVTELLKYLAADKATA